VKVGDLVSYVVNRPGFPTKEGLIVKDHGRFRGRKSFTVLFLDGTQNSHSEDQLEVISESKAE